MGTVPDNFDALLTRQDAAEALTASGFKISPKTLATYVSRGGGPPYEKWGMRPLYRWGKTIAWAQGRLSGLVQNSSEYAAQKQATSQPKNTEAA